MNWRVAISGLWAACTAVACLVSPVPEPQPAEPELHSAIDLEPCDALPDGSVSLAVEVGHGDDVRLQAHRGRRRSAPRDYEINASRFAERFFAAPWPRASGHLVLGDAPP